MSWSWLVAGYVLMWIITGCISCKADGNDPDTATFAGLFWPVFLPIMIIRFIVEKLTNY